MSDILVIFNPAARSEKARAAWETIERFPHCVLAPTAATGDARRLAAEAVAQGFRTVVAAGGDGTINEVANGLAGSEVALGILPVGTMNVFAHDMNLPAKLEACWEIILAGATRTIDLALANEQFFVQLAGVGLDAQVVEATSWEAKKSLGPLSYLISAAQIAARKPPRLVVAADDRTIEGSFVLVGNGRCYGGPLQFFPRAQYDDGQLDVLIFKNLGYLDLARYVGTIVMGTHAEQPDVEYLQTARAEVRSDEEVPVEVDGELAMKVPVVFRIAPERLRVIVRAAEMRSQLA
jgi:YegS/Rv2252/BmrU family lipid kinase